MKLSLGGGDGRSPLFALGIVLENPARVFLNSWFGVALDEVFEPFGYVRIVCHGGERFEGLAAHFWGILFTDPFEDVGPEFSVCGPTEVFEELPAKVAAFGVVQRSGPEGHHGGDDFIVDAAAVLEVRESLDPFPVVAFGVEDDGAGLRQFFFSFLEVLEYAEILELLFDFTRSDVDGVELRFGEILVRGRGLEFGDGLLALVGEPGEFVLKVEDFGFESGG